MVANSVLRAVIKTPSEQLRNAALRVLTVLLAPALLFASDCRAEAPAAPRSLVQIGHRYKLEVVAEDAKFPVRTTHGAIDGAAAGRAALKRYAPIFIREFGRYPVELIRATQLKRVVLCQRLKFAGQRRTGIPDFEHDTLYLDVARGIQNTTYMRAVIHHEFFHIIDYRDDWQVYRDKHWLSLNRTGFQYGTGGINAQGNAMSGVLTEKYPGFLNHYSTTGVEEDKAEVFSRLLVSPEYVAGRVAKDKVLRAKVDRMKALVNRFCPDVDDRFWKPASRHPKVRRSPR